MSVIVINTLPLVTWLFYVIPTVPDPCAGDYSDRGEFIMLTFNAMMGVIAYHYGQGVASLEVWYMISSTGLRIF